MPIVTQTTPPQSPSLLEIIKRVHRECRLATITALDETVGKTQLCIDAVNDAQRDIWNRNDWDWKKREGSITVVADQSSYVLPGDYDRSDGWPTFGGVNRIQELTETQFWDRVGSPTNAGWTSGRPEICYVQGSSIRFYLPPSSDFQASFPTIQLRYFVTPPRVMAAADQGDSLDVPIEMVEAVVCFTKARMLRFLERQQFEVEREEARFNSILQRELMRTRKTADNLFLRRRGGLTQGMRN